MIGSLHGITVQTVRGWLAAASGSGQAGDGRVMASRQYEVTPVDQLSMRSSQQSDVVIVQQAEERVIAEVVGQRTVRGGREAGRGAVEEGGKLLFGIVA